MRGRRWRRPRGKQALLPQEGGGGDRGPGRAIGAREGQARDSLHAFPSLDPPGLTELAFMTEVESGERRQPVVSLPWGLGSPNPNSLGPRSPGPRQPGPRTPGRGRAHLVLGARQRLQRRCEVAGDQAGGHDAPAKRHRRNRVPTPATFALWEPIRLRRLAHRGRGPFLRAHWPDAASPWPSAQCLEVLHSRVPIGSA